MNGIISFEFEDAISGEFETRKAIDGKEYTPKGGRQLALKSIDAVIYNAVRNNTYTIF